MNYFLLLYSVRLKYLRNSASKASGLLDPAAYLKRVWKDVKVSVAIDFSLT